MKAMGAGRDPAGGRGPAEAERDEAGAVLARVRSAQVQEWAASAAQMREVATWAVLHEVDPAEAKAEVALLGGMGTAERLGGVGCPLVEEFCIAELATVLGMATEAGRALLAEVCELVHRLPRVWARVQALELPGWRARRIARATMPLPVEAAGFVDARIAHLAHRVGPVVVDRLVAEAEQRFDPGAAAARLTERGAGPDARCFVVDHRQVSFDGTSRVWGVLDLADALDLDAAVAARAGWLVDLGCEEPLEVRRALAVGEIARADQMLDLDTSPGSDSASGQGPDSQPGPDSHPGPDPEATPRRFRRGRRQVVLYLHLSASAVAGTGSAGAVGRLENSGDVLSAEQVRAWIANPYTQVSVKPVLDLAGHVHTAAYEVPDRFAEQIRLRDVSCVFPFCERRALRCDLDHVVAHGRGGATCSENLAPLCRAHHRLKTHHGRWGYTTLDPGTYLWRSPHGYHFLRDHTGTRDVTPASA